MGQWNGKKLVYLINAICGLSIFFFGYDQGLSGALNISPDYIVTMGLGNYVFINGVATIRVTESFLQGLIVSVYYLGTLVGCLMGGYFGDRLGRKKALWIGCAWILIGAPLQAAATNRSWVIGARVVNGVGTGILNAIVPPFSAEVNDQFNRGYFLSAQFFLNIFGVVVAYWLAYGLSFVGDGTSSIRWRLPVAFQLVPLIALAVCIFWVPESPRYLAASGKPEQALAILGRLRSEDGQVNEEAQKEFDAIQRTIRTDGAKSFSYYQLTFTSQGSLHLSRRTQLVIWLQILQEWTGIAIITVFQSLIFVLAGYDARKTALLSGVNTITYMFSTLVSVFTLDRWGRRVVMFYGAVLQGFALMMAGVFIHLVKTQPQNATNLGAGAVFMVFLFTAAFGCTWLTVPWLYPSEIYPVSSRAKGNALGVVGWSLGNFMTTLVIPLLFNSIGEVTLYISAAANALAIIVVYLFYPETANRSLEDIGYLFSSDSLFAWNAEKEFARHTALDAAKIASEGEESSEVAYENSKDAKGSDSKTNSINGSNNGSISE